MLSHAKLPNSFWAEALNHDMYVVNLSPSIPLPGDIPQRVWSGKEVSYKQLKVFGCKVFVHIPRDERSKLDSKTKQCIYLSSPSDEFGYRLWDPIKKKIVRSRDVVFIEDEIIQDIGKLEKPKATTPQVVLDPVNPPLVHDDHGGDDEDAEDSDDATDQGSTSQGHDQPSSDDEGEGDDNAPTPLVQ
jgi:hypothetical protein